MVAKNEDKNLKLIEERIKTNVENIQNYLIKLENNSEIKAQQKIIKLLQNHSIKLDNEVYFLSFTCLIVRNFRIGV